MTCIATHEKEMPMKSVNWKRWVVAGVLGSAAWISAGAQAQALKEGD